MIKRKVCLILMLSALLVTGCRAKEIDVLTDYLNESVLILSEHFGDLSSPDILPESISIINAESEGLSFKHGHGKYYGGLIDAVTCYGTHYPILGELYGDSLSSDFISYFEANGFIPEPSSDRGTNSENMKSYVDPLLRYVYTLEVPSVDEEPNQVTVTTFYAPSYEEEWQVRYVQTVLTQMGFDPGPIDGKFGAKTSQAIRDYQEHYGIEATGEINLSLLSALEILWDDPSLWDEDISWQEDYLKYLIAGDYIYEDDNYLYSLIYVDEDDIPELVLKKVSSSSGSKILTWHDGHLSQLNLARPGYLYSHKQNVLSDSSGITGGYWDFIYRIEDGEWKRIEEGRYSEDTTTFFLNRETDPDATMTYRFYWNGAEVDARTYEENFRAYLPAEEASHASITYYYWELEPILRSDEIENEDTGEIDSYERIYKDMLTDSALGQMPEKLELTELVGLSRGELAGLLDLSKLQQPSEDTYFYPGKTIDGRVYGYTLGLEDGKVKKVETDYRTDIYTILGIYPGMRVGDAIVILGEKGYSFQDAGSTRGTAKVWAGYVKGTMRLSFVTTQNAAYGAVTEESQLSMEHSIESISLKDMGEEQRQEQRVSQVTSIQSSQGEAANTNQASYAASDQTSYSQSVQGDAAFYGIWCQATKDYNEAQSYARELSSYGFGGQVFYTTDWENLNTEPWYVVTAGTYSTYEAAENTLWRVQDIYPDAYVKYSGPYRSRTGSTPAVQVQPQTQVTMAPFYGIWVSASRYYDDMALEAGTLSGAGLSGQVFLTTDWSNLNPDPWYVLTAGTYASEQAAYDALWQVQRLYPDAYVKYSGQYIG